MRISLTIAVLALAARLAAVEQLVVGDGGLSFLDARETSNRLSVLTDSIWIWDIEDGQNIAEQVLQRGGAVFPVVVRQADFGPSVQLPFAPSLENIVDGDAKTSFSPAEIGLENQLDLYIDLGGHYGVEQIRFFPRLDAEHRDDYLQAFQLGHNREDLSVEGNSKGQIIEAAYSFLINANVNSPNNQSIVIWPRPNQATDEKEMRYVRIRTLNERPWEIAEVEIIANGDMPSGEYISTVLEVRNAAPVWGRLLVNGQDPSEWPIIVQTRTGPDLEPRHYYATSAISGELERIDRVFWESFDTLPATPFSPSRGPIVDNPFWSPWETVDLGVIVSPPERFIQFRVQLLRPGSKIEQLTFEFTSRPLAQELKAEIAPVATEPGIDTGFTLSLSARRVKDLPGEGESGFRFLEVLSPTEIVAIDSVLIQDRPSFFDAEITPGRGFTLHFLERIAPAASFVQVFFRGRVFVDGTTFRVRALDRRSTGTVEEDVYQFARAGDVDQRTPGGSLSVRLADRNNLLVDELTQRTVAFTPNGDRVNDYLELSYNLLKLTQAAPVFFEIYDLAGRKVQRGYISEDLSGSFLRLWDGRATDGELVPPGTYLYQVQVESDDGVQARQGVVNVVY
jgi:hypothetical protein